MMLQTIKNKLKILYTTLAFDVALSFILAWPIQLVWNYTLNYRFTSMVFGSLQAGYWDAFWLMILMSLLCKSRMGFKNNGRNSN